MSDQYLRQMQDYAERNRRNAIDASDSAPPAAPAPVAMSQADFGYGKRKATSAQNAKLAELLKKQAQESGQ